ncbi:MAG: hypothetical protein M1813_006716 [Trichoglossum hirsutum]|nr:MAG: hypothetical protein M1813_006716 [Trichoglossum hirsutum]
MITATFLTYQILANYEVAWGAPVQNSSNPESVQNLTALQTEIAPAWVPIPKGRGTWNLLYSCSFTLGLCVWTAIHLNVLPKDDTRVSFWLRKIKWVLLALFTPELVLFSAWQQWHSARTLRKEYNKVVQEVQPRYLLQQEKKKEYEERKEKEDEKERVKMREEERIDMEGMNKMVGEYLLQRKKREGEGREGDRMERMGRGMGRRGRRVRVVEREPGKVRKVKKEVAAVVGERGGDGSGIDDSGSGKALEKAEEKKHGENEGENEDGHGSNEHDEAVSRVDRPGNNKAVRPEQEIEEVGAQSAKNRRPGLEEQNVEKSTIQGVDGDDLVDNDEASVKSGTKSPRLEVNAISEKDKIYGVPSPLSMTQAFYVVMGGVHMDVLFLDVLRPETIYDRGLPWSSYYTLTPEGLLYYATHDVFLSISEETIRDKSKADILAKGLVCFQVIWMLLQCIARKASRLPVTLLEVHTMVHVFCALSMYTFWFYKPLDVKYPSGAGQMRFSRIKDVNWAWNGSLSIFTDEGYAKVERVTKTQEYSVSEKSVKGTSGRLSYHDDTNVLYPWSHNVSLQPLGHLGFGGLGKFVGWDFPKEQMWLIGVAASLSVLYGGIHAAAWRFQFPTPIEGTLWKASCLATIGGSIPAILAVMALGDSMKRGRSEFWTIFWSEWCHKYGQVIDSVRLNVLAGSRLMALFVLVLPVIVAARLYIVFEAFLSLRHVPLGAYATGDSDWSQYIPHL